MDDKCLEVCQSMGRTFGGHDGVSWQRRKRSVAGMLALALCLLPRADAVSLRSLRTEGQQSPPLPRVPPAAAPPGAAGAGGDTLILGPQPGAAAEPKKRPKISKAQCKQLEEAMLLKPSPKCKDSTFATDYDGCVCTFALPHNINPSPDIKFDMFPEEIEPDPNIPTEPPLELIPPPTNPAQPYVAPAMPAKCPYGTACQNATDPAHCVGYDSWGFAEVHLGSYSPASGYLNTITCSYIMKADGVFTVPVGPVAAAQSVGLAAMRQDQDALRVQLQCSGRHISGTLSQFCTSALRKHHARCDETWAAFLSGRCEVADAPAGFAANSSLEELCPGDCQAVRH
eukprot:TRINITY_DN124402_c0_g1_i1.p1 TRINITY_DN124402_c0_g1~~TRINITY_DN124402_c0_g1_i1.p1  ORF type:complete len:341 (+),score=56.81 TRINITY_DN124402_c0_g1_i1:53-1075(+)